MDLDRIRRRQSLKVIVSEAIMVIAVVFMVVILAFIVSGYWVNPDFEIERQGLLQVSSIPTGADIKIDDNTSWLQKTNTSKVLASGKHTVTLSKEGYDSWSKDINISEGLLYRLNYPRLFLKNREIENVFETTDLSYVSISPNHENMLLIDDTTGWTLINLNNDNIKNKKLDVSKILSTTKSDDGQLIESFDGQILDSNWDKDSAHILIKVSIEDNIEWILIDINNLSNSINLTKSFGYNFDIVKIIHNSANILLVTQNGNLHKIDTISKSISSVLMDDVVDFSYFKDQIVFSAHKKDTNLFHVGIMDVNNNKITDFEDFVDLPQITIGKFYDDQYIAIVTDKLVSLYKTEDFSKLKSFELSFSPDTIKIGHNSDFIVLHQDNNFATIDMESLSLTEWQIESNDFGWVDGYMIYVVTDGELVVYDYDGLNRRALSKNVSPELPVTIANDKWLYYFSDNSLTREWLISR